MNTASGNTAFGPPVIRMAGDMGVLVEFGDRYHPRINAAVLAFDAAFEARRPDGVIETVPTFRSFLVRFDPLALDCAALEELLSGMLESCDWYESGPPARRRKWVIPAVYGGMRGPDLGEVADLMGLREDQVIDSHAGTPFTVAMLGFSPGLAYLGQLPEIWDIARRTTLNPEVPAGAVLVAVRQTVLPSTPIPTGWRQIARTPFRSFNPASDTPFLLQPGDSLRFEPVDEAAYAAYSAYDMDALLHEEGA